MVARNSMAGSFQRSSDFKAAALPKSNPSGPPLIPHRIFMRENCLVCHNDPNRKEIVQTTHAERRNYRQCHISQQREVAIFRENERVKDAVAGE